MDACVSSVLPQQGRCVPTMNGSTHASATYRQLGATPEHTRTTSIGALLVRAQTRTGGTCTGPGLQAQGGCSCLQSCMPIRMPGSLALATCWSITSFERGPRQLQLMIDFAQVVITGGLDDVQASLRNSSIRTLRRGRTSERRGPKRGVGQSVFPFSMTS